MPSPHRTAFVIGELDKGGAEYQLHELLRRLDRRLFAPRVFVLARGGYWTEPIRGLDVVVEELPRGGSADVARLLRLRRGLRAFAPTILHTIMWSGNSYGRLAAVGLGVPVVVAAERNVIRRPAWQRWIERGLDRMTDAYVVNSQAITEELVSRGGLAPTKIRVVPNGIDLAAMPPFIVERRAARQALGLAGDRRLVAQVGRLTAQKDYPTFLRAAAVVAARRDDVDFLVVGGGELRDELEDLARALGLGARVRFTGLRHDVPALLAGVDVLALTSRYEGLPNVVLEAMATGAVAVAADVGGCRELIVPEETGMVVPPQAPDAVAAAVVRLLDDQAWTARLAVAARRRVEACFSVETMAARTADTYRELLRARGLAT
jgi:glycosyltransferase involved in cell wall biosynthesis